MRRPCRSIERGSGIRPGPRFFVVLALLSAAACGVQNRPMEGGPKAPPTPDLAAAEAMLRASAASWNAGDLDGFVDDYDDAPTLAFVGSAGVTRGIDEVRNRYETGYWATGAPADSLRFEDLEFTPLGATHALALGRYVLYRPESAGAETITSTGWFSLVLGLRDGRWRILHDHTSELEGG